MEIIAGNVVTKGYRDVDWVVTNGIDGGGRVRSVKVFHSIRMSLPIQKPR